MVLPTMNLLGQLARAGKMIDPESPDLTYIVPNIWPQRFEIGPMTIFRYKSRNRPAADFVHAWMGIYQWTVVPKHQVWFSWNLSRIQFVCGWVDGKIKVEVYKR